MTEKNAGGVSRRSLFRMMAQGAATLALGGLAAAEAGAQQEPLKSLPDFTGPGANPYWNSVGPIATYPQKLPLVLLTDRPVQLETPRNFFLTPFTPNAAFYVRWPLDEIPTAVDLKEWRLRVEGNVETPLTLSLSELIARFPAVSVAAVNQCSGNSRSRLQPRVPGGQWGNRGKGREGCGAHEFLKSLDTANPAPKECVLAYAMSNEPLPMLNGFPLRIVV